MEKSRRRKIVGCLIVCILALGFFSRTPGAENVRWVQILLLFAAGLNAGVALANALSSRAPDSSAAR